MAAERVPRSSFHLPHTSPTFPTMLLVLSLALFSLPCTPLVNSHRVFQCACLRLESIALKSLVLKNRLCKQSTTSGSPEMTHLGYQTMTTAATRMDGKSTVVNALMRCHG